MGEGSHERAPWSIAHREGASLMEKYELTLILYLKV